MDLTKCKNIHKIVFLSATKFSERDNQRFGIKILRETGYTVDIWDGSAIIFPGSKGNIILPVVETVIHKRIFFNISDLQSAISDLDENTIMICPFALNLNTVQIFKSLSQNNIAYCVYYANAYPIPQYYYSKKAKYKHYFSRISKIGFNNLILAVLNKIVLNYYSYFGINPATYVLVGGTRSIDFVNTPIDKSTCIIKIHAMDYDIYLDERKIIETTSEKLCVFIDTYSPTDPDRFYHGSDSTYYPTEKYYQDMRSLFDHIERKYGYKIVILSHPTMRQDINTGFFGDRERVYGKTANFVKKASCVLSHESTAVNFAVLFKKPILFLTSEEIDKMPNGQNIKTLASVLGKQPIYIDASLDFTIDALLKYDKLLYEDYIHQYLKQTNDDIPAWQIFSNFLKNFSDFGNCQPRL